MLQIVKIVPEFDRRWVVFTGGLISTAARRLHINKNEDYVEWANMYAQTYDLPRGTLFVCIRYARDELDAMKQALQIMETPEFKDFYEANKQ